MIDQAYIHKNLQNERRGAIYACSIRPYGAELLFLDHLRFARSEEPYSRDKYQ